MHHCTTRKWKLLIPRFVEDVNTRQYGSPGGSHSDFVFIFHFSIFVFHFLRFSLRHLAFRLRFRFLFFTFPFSFLTFWFSLCHFAFRFFFGFYLLFLFLTFFLFSWTLTQSLRIELHSRNIASIWWTERRKMNSAIKYEAARLDFLSDVFVAVAFVVA